MKYWDSLNLPPLTSGHPKSGQPMIPLAGDLFIGTCVSLALMVSFAICWKRYWKRSERVSAHPWWAWLGWALIVIACVEITLWAVHFQSSDALAWIVPTLPGVAVPFFLSWYQRSEDRLTTKKNQATAEVDAPPLPSQNTTIEAPAVTPILVPDDFYKRADIDDEVLAEALDLLTILKAGVSELRERIETAVANYSPGKDWKILLGIPRHKLGICSDLIEQLNRYPRRWIHTGEWSFSFSETLENAGNVAAQLRTAMKERASGIPSNADLVNTARRLEDFINQLDSLAKLAANPP